MTQFEARYEAGTLSASQNALRVLKPTVLAVAMGCVGSAWAADGGVVVNGTGRIATQGATTTVTQSTDKMVVNWNNFDIAQGQTVNFAQPNASSAVLNRVVGPVKATDIQGTLNANGRVYVSRAGRFLFLMPLKGGQADSSFRWKDGGLVSTWCCSLTEQCPCVTGLGPGFRRDDELQHLPDVGESIA